MGWLRSAGLVAVQTPAGVLDEDDGAAGDQRRVPQLLVAPLRVSAPAIQLSSACSGLVPPTAPAICPQWWFVE